MLLAYAAFRQRYRLPFVDEFLRCHTLPSLSSIAKAAILANESPASQFGLAWR